MKKISNILIVLFLAMAFNGYSQGSTPPEFFEGKWELLIIGTPNGDSKMVANLARKGGKLTGDLSDPTGKMEEKIQISDIEEVADKITIFFTTQGYDVNVELSKVDKDNLKGSLMNMFDAKAVRIKENAAATDFYAGKWEIAVLGSPRGDIKFNTDLVRKDGKLTGDLVNPAEAAADKRPITKVEESAKKLVIYFMSSQGGEISIDLDKVDNDTLKGSLMNFEANAKRIK